MVGEPSSFLWKGDHISTFWFKNEYEGIWMDVLTVNAIVISKSLRNHCKIIEDHESTTRTNDFRFELSYQESKCANRW